MKSRIAKISLSTVSILLMLALVLCVARPMVAAVQNKLTAFKEQVLGLVEEKTALRITYDSISPNLIGGLRLQGVVIQDALSGDDILSVKQIWVRWSLGKIDFGDVNDILSHIKSVTIDDFSVDWDNQAQAELVQKLLSLAGDDDGNKAEKKGTEKNGFNLSLPFGVILRAFHFRYSQEGLTAELSLPQVKLTPRKDGSTAIALNGTAGIQLDTPLLGAADSFTIQLKAKATLTQVLNGSIASLEVTSDQGDRIKLGTTSLTAKLDNDTVSATLVSEKMPYSLMATYDMESQQIAATFAADNFKPLTLVTVSGGNEWVAKLHDTSISGTYSVSAQLPDLMQTVTYQAQGSVFVPPAVYTGGITARLNFAGNAESVAITTLSAVSSDFDVSYTGAFTFSKLLPEGELAINRYRLPSGKELETLFYIDRLSEGFVIFAPQVYAGDMSLTAVQAECLIHDSSVDFSLEASDYSHYETEVPGVISLSGFASWSGGVDLQAQVSLDSMFAETIVGLVNCVLPEKNALNESIVHAVAPYILSLDAYATTDFKEVVYNVPYAVIADTTHADRMLLFSLGGNETTVSVTQFDLLYAGQEITATISADSDPSYDQIFLSTSLSLNNMPYSLSAAFIDKKYLTVQGDYGFDCVVNMVKSGISGSVMLESMPVAISNYMLLASVDASFEFRSLNDFSVDFNKLAVSENSGAIRIMPSIQLNGSLNQWGMSLSSLTFADTVNTLNGNGFLSWTLGTNENTGATVLSGAALGIDVRGANGKDGISLSATYDNPLKAPFSSTMLMSDTYLVAQASLDHFAVAHVLDGQAADDTITGEFTLQGALENPSIYASVPAAYAKIGGSQVSASFDAVLEDRLASLSNGSFTYSVFSLSQTEVYFDLLSMEGSLSTTAGMTGFIQATTPVSMSFSLGKESQSVQLLIEKLESNVADPIEMYPVNFTRGGGVTALTAGWNEKMQAVLLDSGDFYAVSTGEFPALFSANGSLSSGNLTLGVTDIQIDLSLLSRLLNYDYFVMNGGLVTGSAFVAGTLSDPEFSGELRIKDFSVDIPAFLTNSLESPEVVISAEDNALYLNSNSFTIGEIPVDARIELFLERWSLDYINVILRMADEVYVPGKAKIAFLDVTGAVNVNMDIMFSLEEVSVTGAVVLDHVDCAINNNFGGNDSNNESTMDVFCDISVTLASKAKAYYPSRSNPVVRGLVTTDGPIHVLYDSLSGTYLVTGDVYLRGGEVLYLNRNFYLREGAIYLNETEAGFNPLINLRAETRERTSDGKLVRIILSLPNQRLQSINPVLSSDSSLSELEIRTLLGEAVLVESGTSPGAALGQLAASGVDYLIQNTIIRGVEDRLRDSLHFDIVSIRSPFVQQAVEGAIAESEGKTETVSIGNYFDNTTVYIGKYIGNTVYMDAMFSLRYDENSVKGGDSSYVVQPEIGLEFPAPFANIRWSIAPDLTQSVQNLWVPYTSISLSWKLSL